MGSLILCHKKKAKHPYEISRIHKRVYTIEELCYYLCNNLYLIDYTIMNEQLCHWIADELELPEMAYSLINLIRKPGTVEEFVLKVLDEAKIYTASSSTFKTNSSTVPGFLIKLISEYAISGNSSSSAIQ